MKKEQIIKKSKSDKSKLESLFMLFCKIQEISPELLKGRQKESRINELRQMFIYIAFYENNIKKYYISQILNRNHATILHHINLLQYSDFKDIVQRAKKTNEKIKKQQKKNSKNPFFWKTDLAIEGFLEEIEESENTKSEKILMRQTIERYKMFVVYNYK